MAKLTEEQINSLNIKEGQNMTLITHTGATVSYLIKVKGVDLGRLIYVYKGKRKPQQHPLTTGTILIDGHDAEFITEGNTGSCMIDFRINFMGSPEEVKTYLSENNVNKHFSDFSKVVAVTRSDEDSFGTDDIREEVYPEVAAY